MSKFSAGSNGGHFLNGANDYEQTILSSAQIDVSYNGILQWLTR